MEGRESVLILGDNIFFGNGLTGLLREADKVKDGAHIFSYRVQNASDYGVVTLDANDKILSIEEKPKIPKSNMAVTGLYFYDADAPEVAKTIKPSHRGELEITGSESIYLEKGSLGHTNIYRGFAWFDAGSVEALSEASEFVKNIEKRQGLKISCPEEICFSNGWLDLDELEAIAETLSSSAYGEYLRARVQDFRENQMV